MPLAVGARAPNAQVLALTGEPGLPEVSPAGRRVDLEGLWVGRSGRSGPVILFFYKGDCGASDAAAHVLPRLAEVPGLTVVAISQDGPGDTDAFSSAHQLASGGVRVLVDPEPWRASIAFDVLATPTFVLVEKEGRVAATLEGWSRDGVNALAAHAAGLAGAPPPVVSTAADGPAFRPG